jgi:hypothetical protein
MRRFRAAALFLAASLLPGSIVLAQTQSSPNFQNSDSGVIPMTISAQSSHFSIDGSVEPIVGTADSGSFTLEGGAQGDPGTTPSTGGGGGGGGVAAKLPVCSMLLGALGFCGNAAGYVGAPMPRSLPAMALPQS